MLKNISLISMSNEAQQEELEVLSSIYPEEYELLGDDCGVTKLSIFLAPDGQNSHGK